jgi:hypothetical protein
VVCLLAVSTLAASQGGIRPPFLIRPTTQGGAPDLTCDDSSSTTTSAGLNTFLDSINSGGASANDPRVVCLTASTITLTVLVDWTVPNHIILIGNGGLTTLGGEDGSTTTLIDNVSPGTDSALQFSSVDGYFRMAGLTMQGGTGTIKESGMILIGGTSTQVRFDHFHMDKSTYSTENARTGKFMYIGGFIEGVIDHALFHHGEENGWIHMVNGDLGTSDDHGDVRWSEPTGFGTSDFMFVEDSEFIGTWSGNGPSFATATDCQTGGKYVIRYNTFENVQVGQTHPTGHAGDDRGCRAFEVYGNTATSTSDPVSVSPMFVFTYNVSGAQLTWGNSVGGTNGVYKHIIYFNICRQDSGCGYDPPYGPGATPAHSWGTCGSDGSAWDGNTLGNSYPCIDQPGRGQGDLISGTFGVGAGRTNQTLGSPTWPRQALEPVYEWLTTGDIASGWGGSWLSNGASPQAVQDRDFFLHHGNTGCNAGAGTCSTGVGVGTLAQRPANCALNVAWWATDQGGDWNTSNGTANDGQLYRCDSTDHWTVHYTPYTYPHPLQSTL